CTAPLVVANDELAVCKELEGRPLRIRDCAHHALDRPTERVPSDLRLSIGLVVRDDRVNQPLEVNGSRVPLLIELLDQRPTLERSHRPPPLRRSLPSPS